MLEKVCHGFVDSPFTIDIKTDMYKLQSDSHVHLDQHHKDVRVHV